MEAKRLQELISHFPSRRIAVLGDFFLDKYLDIDPSLVGTSVETGKPAHQVVTIRRSAGAAGTVVNNLSALQAGELHALGAVGDDGEAFDLRKSLESVGCSTSGLLQFDELMTPTYLKPREADVADLSGEHERYDTKNRQATSTGIIDRVLGVLDTILDKVDAVVIVDQVEEPDCGIVTGRVREALSARALGHRDIVFWADSRANIRRFRNVIIKPNQFETVGHCNPLPDDRVEFSLLNEAVPRLKAETRATVCVTLGDRGMLVSDPDLTHVPTVALDGPLDVTGAGDSATAGAVLALASGATLPEAALVGNLVASITVQQLAVTGTASTGQVVERLELWHDQHAGR